MKTIDPTEQDEDNKNVPLFLVTMIMRNIRGGRGGGRRLRIFAYVLLM